MIIDVASVLPRFPNKIGKSLPAASDHWYTAFVMGEEFPTVYIKRNVGSPGSRCRSDIGRVYVETECLRQDRRRLPSKSANMTGCRFSVNWLYHVGNLNWSQSCSAVR